MSEETRRRVQRIGREEFGGASVDETVRRLVDEHWRAAAVAAVQHYRETEPQGWQDYLVESDTLAAGDATIGDGWAGLKA